MHLTVRFDILTLIMIILSIRCLYFFPKMWLWIHHLVIIWFWNKLVPLKVSFFSLADWIPTKINLIHHDIINSYSSSYLHGCKVDEVYQHVFLECFFSRNMWMGFLHWLGISKVLWKNIVTRNHQIYAFLLLKWIKYRLSLNLVFVFYDFFVWWLFGRWTKSLQVI